MAKTIQILSLFLLYSLTNAWAQSGSVKGTIKTSDNRPAEFVNVGLKGTSKGTTVNAAGHYEMKNVAPGTYVLVASFIGLETKETTVTVVAGRQTVVPEIELAENASTLKEVVVQAEKSYVRDATPLLSRLEMRSLDNPQSVQVVNQEALRDRQVHTVAEALQLMAGVNAFSSSQYSDYVMRGFRTSPGNFAYNGIRGDFYQFDQAALTYNLESLEVVKGPASVLFSAGNPGGVINHVTKKAKHTPRYEATFTLGSFDQYRALLDATGPATEKGKLLYRLIVGYENTGQLDRNQDIENVFLAPQLQYNFSEFTNLNYEFNYQHDRRTMGYQRGVPALYFPETNTYQLDRYPADFSIIDPNGLSRTNSFSHQLTFNHRFNKYFKSTVLLRAAHGNQLQLSMSPANFGQGAVDDSLIFRNQYFKPDYYQNQASAFVNVDFSTGQYLRHAVVAGVDLSYYGRTYDLATFSRKKVFLPNPDFSWGVHDPALVQEKFATAQSQSGTAEKTVLAATYMQDQISLGEKVKVLIGGRLESHFYDTQSRDLVTGEGAGGDTVRAIQFIPRAGLVYLLQPNTSLYISYTQGFQPQYGSNVEAGGPFPPEKSRQYEVGVKHEWLQGRIITSSALYYIQKYDVLAPDPTDENGVKLMQIDNVTSKGLELSAQGKVTRSLDVILNYAYNEATTPGDAGFDYNSPGWFPNAPNTTANAWGKYTVPQGFFKSLGIGAGFSHVGKRNSMVPGFTVPAYTTVDAALSYQYKGLNVQANIYNLSNTRYWHGVYGPGNLWPGNPLSARLTIGYVL